MTDLLPFGFAKRHNVLLELPATVYTQSPLGLSLYTELRRFTGAPLKIKTVGQAQFQS